MQQLQLYGPKNSKFKSLKVHVSSDEDKLVTLGRVQRTLVRYVNKSNPDFFAIAPRAKMDYSSVTEYVIGHVTSSVIICRN